MGYSLLVKNTPEGKGLLHIAYGLALLLVFLLLIGILGAAVPLFKNTNFLHTMIIIKNHLPALTALLAFAYLYVGSLKLIRTPSSGLKPENRVVSTLLFIGGAIAFTWAFANSPTASLQQADGIAVYAVPHDVLLLSLVLPYLFAWLLGLHASMNITAYAKNVKGSIYRQALRRVARGMMVIIIFTIVLQLITVATPILNHMKLGSVILVLYLIITLYGLGAYCITAGARKLTLIEVAQ